MMPFQTPGEQQGFAQQQAQAQQVLDPQNIQQKLAQLQDPNVRMQLAQQLAAQGIPAPQEGDGGPMQALGGNPGIQPGGPGGLQGQNPPLIGQPGQIPPQPGENSVGLPQGQLGSLVNPVPQLRQDQSGLANPALNQARNMQQQAQNTFGPPIPPPPPAPPAPVQPPFPGGAIPGLPPGFDLDAIRRRLQEQLGSIGGINPFGGF